MQTKIDFIDWWNTSESGHPYMTLLQCSWEDLIVVLVVGICALSVFIQYLDVAWHNYMISKKYDNSSTKKYLLFFTAVFLFCGIEYFFRFLSIWYNPYKLLALNFIILNVVTYFFRRYMRQAKAVENMYEAGVYMDKQVNEVYQALEERMMKSLKNEKGDLITFEDVKNLEQGKKYIITENSWFIPVDLSGNILHLFLFLHPGDRAGWHHHNCFEKIQTIEGELIDTVNSEKVTAKIGESIIIDKFKNHNPSSLTGCKVNSYLSKSKFK